MPEPIDHDPWSAEDDELVRRALRSLREDVDHLILAPVETVKGDGHRRRRSAWLTGGIGLAAAAALVGALALSGVLETKPEVTDPATRTSISTPASPTKATSSAPTTATDWHAQADWPALLKQPALLPTGAEWLATVGVTGVTTREGMVPVDLLCGMTTGAGTAVTAQDILIPGSGGAIGVQATWIYPTDEAARAAADAMRAKADDCRTPKPETIGSASSDAYSEHPMMWSFNDSDGNRGWLTVTDRGRHVSYVEFWGRTGARSMLDIDRFAWITNRVENRLELYGESSATGTVIVGPDTRTPPASLFIDPADFASEVFTGGAKTEAGAGEFDGSSAVVPCDTDSDGQGEFGLLKVKLTGRDASYFATERVRAFADVGTAKSAAGDLTSALASCTKDVADNPVTVTPGPGVDTFVLATTLGDGSVFTQYVAVQLTRDAAHLTTLVISPQGKVDQAAAFDELNRLRGLAAGR